MTEQDIETNADELTTAEACEYLGIHISTLHRWRNAGYLTGRKRPDGQLRFTRDELRAVRDARR